MADVDVLVARSPIFHRPAQVYGYELLFGSDISPCFRVEESDQAALKVVADAFFLLGIESLTRGRRAFITFLRDGLLNRYPTAFPRDLVAVQIAPTVEPERDVLQACRELKELGYLIVTDHRFLTAQARRPTRIASIVRVDFAQTPPAERARAAARYAAAGLPLLASRVATSEAFSDAIKLGFTYVEGRFFCQPIIVRGRDIPAFKTNHLRLLREINRPELNYQQIEAIIKSEVALSYKLLRYLNSWIFGIRNRVSSIRQALVLLGESNIRKWASVLILSDLGRDRPPELVVTSVVRARFCEAIARRARVSGQAQDYYFLGLFSLLDALVGRPLADVLAGLPITETTRQALLGYENEARPVLELVLSYEVGDWSRVAMLADLLALPLTELPDLYLEAVNWVPPTDDAE